MVVYKLKMPTMQHTSENRRDVSCFSLSTKSLVEVS